MTHLDGDSEVASPDDGETVTVTDETLRELCEQARELRATAAQLQEVAWRARVSARLTVERLRTG
jgi:hypothetical protein